MIFDSPWNLEETCAWFAIASRVVKRGGLIAFSLFPSLVRPAAESERQLILALIGRVGKFQVFEDALSYETPLFEREALNAAGVTSPCNWRRGDLVVVKVNASLPWKAFGTRSQALPSLWRTYVIRDQVVKVRRVGKGRQRFGLLRPLPGASHFVYATVSARDPQRDEIDLWTSRRV